MFPFKNILFPVDYSAPCEAVIPYLKEIAQRYSANITLVHAYGPEALAHSELRITDPGLPEEARIFEDQRLRQYGVDKFSGQHVDTFAKLGEAGTVLPIV